MPEEQPQAPAADNNAVKRVDELAGSSLRLLQTLLPSANEDGRASFILVCERIGSPAARDLLARLASEDGASSTTEAASALFRLGDVRGYEVLRRQAGSDDPAVRKRLAKALRNCGAGALDILLQLVHDTSTSVCIHAAIALGNSGSGEAIPVLRELLASADGVLRARVMEALVRLDRPEDVQQSLADLKSDDELLQYRGACHLLRLGNDRAMDALLGLAKNAAAPGVRTIAASALCTSGIPIRPEKLADFAANRADEVRKQAVKALGKSESPDALKLLIGLSTTGAPKVRRIAVSGLAASDTPGTRNALSALLADPEITYQAVQAYLKLPSPTPEAQLLRWAADLPGRRRVAAILLRTYNSPEALEALLTLSSDYDEFVRLEALRSVATYADARAYRMLLQGWRTGGWWVQFGAALGLEVMGSVALAYLAEDVRAIGQSQMVREAIVLLDKLADPADVRLLILTYGTVEPDTWKRAAQEALRSGDQALIDHVLAAVSSQDPRVRTAAIEVLGVEGNAAGVPALVTHLGGSRWESRQVAIASLRRIGVAAVEPLADQLAGSNSRRVRAAIVDVLGQIGSGAAVEPLLRALSDPGRLVRGNAATALGAIGDPRAVTDLVATLEDEDTGVRNAAGAALRTFDGPEAASAVQGWVRRRRRPNA